MSDPTQLARAQQPGNPLHMLPVEWRSPVGLFFGAYSDVLKGSFGLVTCLNLWVQDEGLTLAEATRALRRVMRPGARAGIDHAGKLMAVLAEEVETAMRPRKYALRQLAQQARLAAAMTPDTPMTFAEAPANG